MSRAVTPQVRLNRRILSGVSAVALIAPILAAGSAHAISFNRGELSGSFDTTLTVGALFRVEDRDPDLVGVANGGRANSINGDNGNLNYDKGLVSLVGRATHELKLTYGNIGAFVRGTYFLDIVNVKRDSDAFGRTGAFPLSDQAIERVGKDAQLLDALVYGGWSVGDNSYLDIRLGNQVLSWGESTFIPNGINTINPVNVSALRLPGAELKEGFLPVPIADVSFSLNENFSIEGFYQFKWDNTEPEAANTFFSTSDAASPGADYLFIGFGNYLIPDNRSTGAVPGGIVFPANLYPNPALDPFRGVQSLTPFGSVVPRLEDDLPKDQGQYGFAARYFAQELGNTEFGAYYINYHSRLPVLSSVVGSYQDFVANVGAGAVNPTNNRFTEASGYRVEYPEDIQLLGASFNTTIPGGISLQGEYSYRMDQPLQLDDVELLQATLAAPTVLALISQGQTAGIAAGQAQANTQYQAAVNQVLAAINPALVGTPFTALPPALQGPIQTQIAALGGPASYQAALIAGAQAGGLAGANAGAAGAAGLFNTNQIIQKLGRDFGYGLIPSTAAAASAFVQQNYFGQRIQGWDTFDVSQFQMTGTKAFGPFIGSNQWVLVAEAGMTYIHDMPDGDVLRLEGPGTVVGGNPFFLGRGGMPAVATDGFATEFSWGYRAAARFDYLNAFSGVNLFPSISFAHDVQGTTPSPLGNFIEGRMALGLGVRAVIREAITVDLNYSAFFGGGENNLISDRDFVSVSVKYFF